MSLCLSHLQSCESELVNPANILTLSTYHSSRPNQVFHLDLAPSDIASDFFLFKMSVVSPKRLRARVAPHLHWQVPFEAGVYANSPRWSNKGCPSFIHVLISCSSYVY